MSSKSGRAQPDQRDASIATAHARAARPGNTLPRLAPFGLYRCADVWVALAAPQDKLAVSLISAKERPGLAGDFRFATRDARVQHDHELTTGIERWTSTLNVRTVVEALPSKECPWRRCGHRGPPCRLSPGRKPPPCTIRSLGVDERYRAAGIPLRLSGRGVGFVCAAPRLGEHTEEVLTDVAGYSEECQRQLRRDGVV